MAKLASDFISSVVGLGVAWGALKLGDKMGLHGTSKAFFSFAILVMTTDLATKGGLSDYYMQGGMLICFEPIVKPLIDGQTFFSRDPLPGQQGS